MIIIGYLALGIIGNTLIIIETVMYIYDNKISMRIKIKVILHINWLRMVLGNFKYTQWQTYNWVHHNNENPFIN